MEELDIVLTKIKSRKAAGLNEIPSEIWKTRKFNHILLQFCNAVNKQNREMDKRMHPPFFKKDDLRITKNYRAMTLTSIAVKVYGALLLNCIKPEIEKILKKNQNGFQRNWSTTSQILTIRWINEVHAKNLEATLLFINFTKAFNSMHSGKMEQILLAYGTLKETITVIKMLYKKHKSNGSHT